MQSLNNAQKKYLRGLANTLKPQIIIGKNGLSEPVIKSIDEALTAHELVKIKYNEFKEDRAELNQEIVSQCQCHLIGDVGHTALIYRQHPDPDERTINLPK